MSRNVLIIEDEQELAKALKLHLESLSCAVQVAFRGDAGLRMAESRSFDLILLDIMLPGMDGLEVCRRLRTQRVYTPVLMITANDQKDVRYDALLGGANDFLTKPIDRIEFSARARNMLSLRTGQKFLADRAEHLSALVDARTEEIRQREKELIFRISRAAEFRDPETGAHIQRMAHYSQVIAVGPMSGRSNVTWFLEERGLTPTDEQVQRVLDLAKKTPRLLTEAEILAAVRN